MFKKCLTALGITAGALILGSCGGGGDTYTIFLYQENVVYDENMPVFQRANEYAGIELEGILQTYDTNYDSVYTLQAADIDLVVNDQDTIEASALREGMFADLTNLIEEHAPNLKAYFDANPEQKEWATASDGKIYGIPFYTDGLTAKGYFVRLDWVRILRDNNKLPKGISGSTDEELKASLDNMTVATFEELLKAFVDNKNLINPTATGWYPYFDRDTDFVISELAALWGGTADYYLDENGKVHYGILEDEFHDALNHIIDWAAKGIINTEILNESTDDKRVTYYAQNSGGVTHDWIGTTYSFNSDVYASNLVEDFEVYCFLPPIREDGTRLEPTTRKLIGNVTAINADLPEEDQINLIKWIDFFFTEEGKNLSNWGVEGEDYTVEADGSFKYTENIINDNATALANLYARGAQLQAPGVQDFAYEEAWLSPEAAKAMEDYDQYLNKGYNDLIYPNAKLLTTDYTAVNAAKSSIAELLNQNVATWIKRGTAISDQEWNLFKQSIQSAGSQNVIDVLQRIVDEKNK